jgi:pimeloyl-ACP methyl ester carboxylesterase
MSRLALFLVLLAGCNPANAVLLWPPSGPTDAGGAQRRTARDGDANVEIWTMPTPNPRAYVLRFYGNGALAQWELAYEASQLQGVEMWGVNYRGYGGSDGPATLRGVASSSLAAYDALAAEAHGKPIYVFGTSLGATAALHVAARRDVKGVVLVNPPPLRRLVLERHGWWNLFLVAGPTALGIPSDLDSEDNARKTNVPAVIVTSEDDGIVPLQYQGRVIGAYAGPKTVIQIPAAGHNDAPPPEIGAKIRDAVVALIQPPVQPAP